MPCLNGHQTPADASFCPTCGAAASSAVQSQYPALPPAPAGPLAYPQSYPVAHAASAPVPTVASNAAPRSLYTAAAIINWVVLGLIIFGTLGIGIICAAWFVPMTIQMHKGGKGPYKHTSLGVCTLLFCNIVSGILLLVDDSSKPPKPTYAIGR